MKWASFSVAIAFSFGQFQDFIVLFQRSNITLFRRILQIPEDAKFVLRFVQLLWHLIVVSAKRVSIFKAIDNSNYLEGLIFHKISR